MSLRGWLLYLAVLSLAVVVYASTVPRPIPSRGPVKVSKRSRPPIERKQLTAQQYFDLSDKDHDGKISLTEWVGTAQHHQSERRRKMFLAADEDHNGFWNLQEWRSRGKAMKKP